jgi:hypothetical protein
MTEVNSTAETECKANQAAWKHTGSCVWCSRRFWTPKTLDAARKATTSPNLADAIKRLQRALDDDNCGWLQVAISSRSYDQCQQYQTDLEVLDVEI